MFRDLRNQSAGNLLIDRLPQVESRRLTSRAESIELSAGQVLYRQDGPIRHVYFPTSGCCCHVVSMDEGRQIEAATIGKEGMVGIHRALGLEFSPCKMVSVVPGEALRVPIQSFLEIMSAGGALDTLIKKYAAFCLCMARQTVGCTAIHTVEQRVCRWLLMARDRVGKDEFALTQELLGQMLGVCRQSITLAATRLQAAGLIEYRRGTIQILNRQGLESASCECYQIAKTAYESIMAE